MAKLYPVVHINSPDIAIEQASLALEAGADGVFLIDHKATSTQATNEVFNQLHEDHPNAFLGVNFLGFTAVESVIITAQNVRRNWLSRTPDALWVDNLSLASTDGPSDGARYLIDKLPLLHSMELFGGVAFKYTDSYTDDPRRAAFETTRSLPCLDVVTTSGPGTGEPPSVAKIAAMKEAAVGHDLAIASGVDITNIDKYAGLADRYLAASSVETARYSGIFHPVALTELIAAAHEQ